MTELAPARSASANSRSVKLSATVGDQGTALPPRSVPSTFSSVTMPVPEVDVTLERNSWITIQGHVEIPEAVIFRELTSEDVESQIAHYECRFSMSSEEFLKRWREGTAPDTFETMDWLILLRHR